jgi:hypothetical protein
MTFDAYRITIGTNAAGDSCSATLEGRIAGRDTIGDETAWQHMRGVGPDASPQLVIGFLQGALHSIAELDVA